MEREGNEKEISRLNKIYSRKRLKFENSNHIRRVHMGYVYTQIIPNV